MKKFLIVDDQPAWINFNTQAVREILGNNVDIVTASSAQEAYNLLLENFSLPFDCIITDMQMEDDYAPKMAGEWLIEQAKEIPPYFNAKIIIISASMQSKQIAENLGVEFLSKAVAVNSPEAYKTLLNT